METEKQLSSLFHSYINFMFTTKDRYVVKASTEYPCEVCGYWRHDMDTFIRRSKASISNPHGEAAYWHHRRNKMTSDLPIMVIKYNHFVMMMYCTPSDQPDLMTLVKSKDWVEIIKEASRLGLYVDTKAFSKSKVVPFVAH